MPDTCQPASLAAYQLVEPGDDAVCSHATADGAAACGSKRNRDRQGHATWAFIRLNPGPRCQTCGSPKAKAA